MAAEQEVLVPQVVKPMVNMQTVATQPSKVQPRAILWEAVVVVAGLVGHLQQTVPMLNMAEAVEARQGTVETTAQERMAAPLFMEVAVAQVVDKKVGTHLGPLAIGEVTRLALVPPHEPQTKQASQEQVESLVQVVVALVAVVQMEAVLVKLAAQAELHQVAEGAEVLLIQARAVQAEQEPEAR